MQLKLKIIGGSHDGRKIDIKSSRFLIGRSKDCHLRPGGSSIGEHHCAIVSKEGLVVLQLLKNKSEVLVNDKPVKNKQKLMSGDRLKIGSLQFELLISSTKTVKKKQSAQDPAKKTSDTTIDDDVGQWLDEADEQDNQNKIADPDSRVFTPSELPAATSDDVEEEEVVAEESEKESAKNKAEKKEPGKLPPPPVEETKDSRDAAMQTLRKLFNRST